MGGKTLVSDTVAVEKDDALHLDGRWLIQEGSKLFFFLPYIESLTPL